MRVLAAIAAAAAAALAPTAAAAPGPVTTELGFEAGDFSAWDGLNGNLLGRSPQFEQRDLLAGNRAVQNRYFGIVSNPVAEGRFAFRSTVDANARAPGEAGQRAIVLLFPSGSPEQNPSGAYEGAERWYRTRILFPEDFDPSPDASWNWLVQWHNWPDGVCCANLAISADTRDGAETLSLRVMGGGDRAHPIETSSVIAEQNPAGSLRWFVGDPALKRGHWYDSLVHVRWSASPRRGYVEWWLDGRRIVSRAMPTLYWYADADGDQPGATPGPGQAYYMEGYYRSDKLPDGTPDTSTETVYFDGARIGKTAAAVAP
jgi:hypothetical protein